MKYLRHFLAATAVTLLTVPAAAAAAPGQRSFGQTYPYASRLCALVAGGHVPKRLARYSDPILSACGQLKSSFVAAQSNYQGTIGSLRQQALDTIAQVRQTCREDRLNHDQAGCRQARQQGLATLKGLLSQAKAAVQAYHAAVEAARRTFWSTIRSLPGGGGVQSDSSVGPSPTPDLPSSSAILTA